MGTRIPEAMALEEDPVLHGGELELLLALASGVLYFVASGPDELARVAELACSGSGCLPRSRRTGPGSGS